MKEQFDELTINMRQKNDKTNSDILFRIRFGTITKVDIAELQKRQLQFHHSEPSKRVKELCDYLMKLDESTVCLMPNNDICRIINNALLARIDSEEIHFLVDDAFHCNNSIRQKILKLLEDDNDSLLSTKIFYQLNFLLVIRNIRFKVLYFTQLQ